MTLWLPCPWQDQPITLNELRCFLLQPIKAIIKIKDGTQPWYPALVHSLSEILKAIRVRIPRAFSNLAAGTAS